MYATSEISGPYTEVMLIVWMRQTVTKQNPGPTDQSGFLLRKPHQNCGAVLVSFNDAWLAMFVPSALLPPRSC